MGNITSSRRPNSFQHLKEQVKVLGDKYPFGDDEILRIARCLAYLRIAPIASSKDVINYSFLNNWAVYCSTLPPADFNTSTNQNKVPFLNLLKVDENLIINNDHGNGTDVDIDDITKKRIKMRKLILLIEENILPPSFGQKLEETIFALLVPSNTTISMDENTTNQELTMQRLEKFLNGLSDSSRRGSRKSLEVIYKCCAAMKSKGKNGKNESASAKDLVDLAYRLSLASLVMGIVLNDDNSDTIGNDENSDENDNGDDTSKNENNSYAEDDEDNERAPTSIRDLDVEDYDLTPYYPQQIDQSLTQSLIEFASNQSSLSSASASIGTDYLSMTTGSNHIAFSNATIEVQNKDESNTNHDDNNDDNDTVSLEVFTAWAESNAQCLSASIETFLHRIFFPDKPYPPSRMEFVYPLLRGQHSAFFKSKSSPLLFTFASMSPSLGGAWFRLYTSDEDGLSFNRLQNALLGYGGPTLLIIKEAEGGGIFGAFTSTKWKETKDFYGNSDCFLFQLQPMCKVIRPRGRGGNNFMYCNSESRSRGYDGQAHGIGFGGTTEKPRLFLAETFDGCIASASDLTFEAGALLPPLSDVVSETMPTNRKYFDIQALEVWGVGGDDQVAKALGDRNEQREIAAANIRKARKVDKAAFLDDFKSGLIESKAFKHRGEMRGRGDCELDENDKKKYDYVK